MYSQITFFLIKIVVNSSSRLFHFDFRVLWRCKQHNNTRIHGKAFSCIPSFIRLKPFSVGMSNNNLLSHCIFVSNWNFTMKNSFICSTHRSNIFSRASSKLNHRDCNFQSLHSEFSEMLSIYLKTCKNDEKQIFIKAIATH